MKKERMTTVKKLTILCMVIALLLACTPVSLATEDGPTIQVAYMITQNPAEDHQLIEAEINRIMHEKGYQFNVELVLIDYTSWGNQLQLMLSDGTVDLFNLHGMASLASLADNESVAAIDDLLAEYGQGIVDTLGEYLESQRFNGKLYGTPNLAAYSKRTSFIMNKDLADGAGVDIDAIKDLDSLTEQLKKIKETYPDVAAITTGKGACYYSPSYLDRLGTDIYACLMLDKDNLNTTVVNYFATEDYKMLLKYAETWADAGFFRKDAINAQEANFAPMGAGAAFGGFYNSPAPSILEGTFSQLFNFPVVAVTLQDVAWITTSDIGNNIWAIPEMSGHKTEAMQLLNELYINPELENLVCNGIEGVHYRVTEDGNADYVDESQNILTIGWPAGGMSDFWPNMMLTYPWSPSPADEYKAWMQTNEAAVTSPAFGFVFDSSEVIDQLTACDNAVAKYFYAMMLHAGDTDEMLESFLKELDAAGVNDVIAEKQRQLDEWLSSK